MEDMLRVGVISSTHGIKGEVKVFPTTDDVKRYNNLKKVFINVNQNKTVKNQIEIKQLEITGVKYFKQFVIVKFKGIDNINDIEKYKGLDLYVLREDAVKLQKDEYFITDLIGLKVIDEDNNLVGKLEDVLQTGANDVYVIKASDGYNQKEILLPAIKECILEVNIDEEYIKVHLMEGLLD